MAKLDKKLTARKVDFKSGEQTKAFKDTAGHFVSATALVDDKGKIADLRASSEVLEFILHELKEMNTQLTILIG